MKQKKEMIIGLIAFSLHLVLITGCGDSMAVTPSSNVQGPIAEKIEYNPHNDWYADRDDKCPIDVDELNANQESSNITVSGNQGTCKAEDMLYYTDNNTPLAFTNAETEVSLLYSNGVVKEISYCAELQNASGLDYDIRDAVEKELTLSSYEGIDYSTYDENYEVVPGKLRRAKMMKDCIVEITDVANTEGVFITYYFEDAYAQKYSQEAYNELIMQDKRVNELYYLGSIAANQLLGGWMATTPEQDEYYYTEGKNLWAWDSGNRIPLAAGNNIRYINVWDGYVYYMTSNSIEGSVIKDCSICKLEPLSGTVEILVTDAIDYGTGFWIKEGIMYYNAETRVGAKTTTKDLVSYDLATKKELDRKADQMVLAVTYNAMFVQEVYNNNQVVCYYTADDGTLQNYLVLEGHNAVGSILPTEYFNFANTDAKIYTVSGNNYYYVADSGEESCRIMRVTPTSEEMVADVGSYGYSGATALHVSSNNYDLYFSLFANNYDSFGSPINMWGHGAAFVHTYSPDEIYDLGLDCAPASFYRFGVSGDNLYFYRSEGNLYCQNDFFANLDGFPEGFSIVIE